MTAAPLDVRTRGDGPPLLLVHGGVNRDATWRAQAPLAARWRLIEPARRGFPPSPPAPRQDWEVDARDLGGLLAAEPRTRSASPTAASVSRSRPRRRQSGCCR